MKTMNLIIVNRMHFPNLNIIFKVGLQRTVSVFVLKHCLRKNSILTKEILILILKYFLVEINISIQILAKSYATNVCIFF